MAVAFKQTDPHDPQIDYLNGRHFVVVLADTRGSGASSGHRETEFSPEIISDLGGLVNWVASQPWSNGRVGTFGNSYEGATAELTAATNPPALKAVVPISSQFDLGMLIFPGGMYNENMVQSWSAIIPELDQGDVCVTKGLSGLGCWWAGRSLHAITLLLRIPKTAPYLMPVKDLNAVLGWGRVTVTILHIPNAMPANQPRPIFGSPREHSGQALLTRCRRCVVERGTPL